MQAIVILPKAAKIRPVLIVVAPVLGIIFTYIAYVFGEQLLYVHFRATAISVVLLSQFITIFSLFLRHMLAKVDVSFVLIMIIGFSYVVIPMVMKAWALYNMIVHRNA